MEQECDEIDVALNKFEKCHESCWVDVKVIGDLRAVFRIHLAKCRPVVEQPHHCIPGIVSQRRGHIPLSSPPGTLPRPQLTPVARNYLAMLPFYCPLHLLPAHPQIQFFLILFVFMVLNL